MKGRFSNGMDPQKLSQLDPKLREAYQRVMGTVIPDPQATVPQTPPTPTPNPEPVAPPQAPTNQQRESFFIPQPDTNPQPQPNAPTIPAPEPPAPAQQSSSNFIQMNSEVPSASSQNFATPPMPQAQTIAVKKKNGMMPILFGIVGMVFLVIYTLFWTKIFNFKLPFLP